MTLWHQPPDLDVLNASSRHTLMEALDIRFDAFGDDWLCASMPVDRRTRQPFGLLHGGASVALAETVGSTAAIAAVVGGLVGMGTAVSREDGRPLNSAAGDGKRHGPRVSCDPFGWNQECAASMLPNRHNAGAGRGGVSAMTPVRFILLLSRKTSKDERD